MNRDEGLYERTLRFFQLVWNEQNDAALPEFLSPELLDHGWRALDSMPFAYDEFIEFRRRFLDAFPDAKFVVESVLVEDSKVAVRYHVQATNLGDGMGFPATGRKVQFTAMSIARWQDGKIVEAWNNFDQLGLLRQLGKAD
jgi:steroid delta-isomerase-like uncharacterized protein